MCSTYPIENRKRTATEYIFYCWCCRFSRSLSSCAHGQIEATRYTCVHDTRTTTMASLHCVSLHANIWHNNNTSSRTMAPRTAHTENGIGKIVLFTVVTSNVDGNTCKRFVRRIHTHAAVKIDCVAFCKAYSTDERTIGRSRGADNFFYFRFVVFAWRHVCGGGIAVSFQFREFY